MSQVIRLQLGDCIERMQEMETGSIGAIVTDPPYGLEFMGEDWDAPWKYTISDHGFTDGGDRRPAPSFQSSRNPTCRNCGKCQRTWKGGPPTCACGASDFDNDTLSERQLFQEWSVGWLTECFRVLAPGGVAKVFGGTRMFHRMAAAMEQVGFVLEPGESLEAWIYGSGFPKSLDISKALDKYAGVNPAVERDIQVYLRESREALGLTKRAVDEMVFGGTTRYSWVEGRGGERADETYLPTPEEWAALKLILELDDRYDDYIQAAIPSRENRNRADGGKAELVGTEDGDWGYQQDGERWDGTRRLTEPVTPEAKRWSGYGTALKPAWEPFLVGRKPREG